MRAGFSVFYFSANLWWLHQVSETCSTVAYQAVKYRSVFRLCAYCDYIDQKWIQQPEQRCTTSHLGKRQQPTQESRTRRTAVTPRNWDLVESDIRTWSLLRVLALSFSLRSIPVMFVLPLLPLLTRKYPDWVPSTSVSFLWETPTKEFTKHGEAPSLLLQVVASYTTHTYRWNNIRKAVKVLVVWIDEPEKQKVHYKLRTYFSAKVYF